MMSWNATSASATTVISSFPRTFSKSSSAFFRSCSPCACIRSHASRTASASSERRTSSTSRRLFSVICATSAPRRGMISTRPSSSSFRMASRIGVRLTPSLLASLISISRSPGFNSPRRIACRSVLNTTSRRGRKSFIFTSNPGSIPHSLLALCTLVT